MERQMDNIWVSLPPVKIKMQNKQPDIWRVSWLWCMKGEQLVVRVAQDL